MAIVDEIKVIVKAETDAAVAKLTQLDHVNKSNTKTGIDMAKSIAGYTNAYALAVEGAQKLISSVANLTKESITLAAGFEQAKIQWGVMLGDMGKGEGMFLAIQKLAASTPLSFQGVEQGARTLKQFGIAAEDIIPTIKMLGDVSGGNEEKIRGLSVVYGQVMSAGRLMGQDLLQLINQGFNPLQEISKTTGESMGELKKRMESGAISSREVAAAFKSATSDGGLFYGMMDKMAQTTAGLWSTAQDNFRQGLAELGEKIIPVVNKALEEYNRQADIAKAKKNLELGTAGSTDYEKLIAVVDKQREANNKLLKAAESTATVEQKKTSAYKAQIEALKAIDAELNAQRNSYIDAKSIQKEAETRATEATKKQTEAVKGLTDKEKELLFVEAGIRAGMKNTQDMYRSGIAITQEVVKSQQETVYLSEASAAALEDAYNNMETFAYYSESGAAALEDQYGWTKDMVIMSEGMAASLEDQLGSYYAVVPQIQEATKLTRDWLNEYDELATVSAQIKELNDAWLELTTSQKNKALELVDTYTILAESFGNALMTGEEGWKAFGKAGLNAIAGIVQGLAKEAEIQAALNLGAILGGDLTKIPALAQNLASVGLAYGAAGAIRAIPMANGGEGIVRKPTMFLAGEAGPEFVSFKPESRGGGGVTIIQNIGGSVIAERQVKGLAMSAIAQASRGY